MTSDRNNAATHEAARRAIARRRPDVSEKSTRFQIMVEK